VTQYPEFGTRLRNLLEQRKLDIDIEETELAAVLGGATPGAEFLRRLAVALGMHAEDLFVLADQPVPDDLVLFRDQPAGSAASRLIGRAKRLTSGQRVELLEYIREFPVVGRGLSESAVPASESQYQPGPGATMLGLFANRNLGWSTSVRVLAEVTPVNVSAATVGTFGRGTAELTSDFLAGSATVLGIPADDLNTLLGTNLPLPHTAPNPKASLAAELIWACRNLPTDQIQQARAKADSMLA
jgi:transcriptional regulator with XRE-family HTH domain